MSKPDESRVIRFAEAQARIPGPNGERSINFLRRGSLDVNLSRPLPPNEQTPHAQDEVYIIIRGRGVLLHEGKRESFEAGDFLFVAAGTEHRFDDFSEDVAYWRVLYGPVCGELLISPESAIRHTQAAVDARLLMRPALLSKCCYFPMTPSRVVPAPRTGLSLAWNS